MNKPKRASKSSDEIINEIFDSLNLPVTEELSEKSKKLPSTIKGSTDISRDSCKELSDSDSDSSSSSDQEIDKLLEEITEITDKDIIKIDEADFTVTPKDKKKKKKKVKKNSDTKTKHKKRKKKKYSKLRNSSDSDSDIEKSKKNKLQKSFSSDSLKDTLKDRSISPDLSKISHSKKSNLKSASSRSRSKSLSKNKSRSRSRSRSKSRSRSRYSVSGSKGLSYYNNNSSKSRYNRSRSSSYSDLDYNRKSSKPKSKKRGSSRSPTYSPPKSRKRETRSRSPVKKEDKEPLDSWKSAKLASLKKSNHPPNTNSADSKPKEILPKSDETTKETFNSETNSNLKISESDKMTKESDNKLSAAVADNANTKPTDVSAKGQEKSKDEGKGKMIVIKNLKESSVLQQAEEAQCKPKDNEKSAENNSQQNNDVKKEDNTEKTAAAAASSSATPAAVKEVKPEPENLLTAFKKSKKEKEEAEKEKKDLKKSKSRSRSRSISRKRSRSRSRGVVSKTQGKRKRSRSTSRSRKRRSRSRDKYKKRSRSRSRSKRSASRDRFRGRRSRSGSRSKDLGKSRKGKRSSSKDKRKSPDCVDSLRDKATRKRLLEIARKNAVYLMKNNCLPPSIEKESVLRATGKSIEELTSFCKQLVSKGDYSDNELSDPSLSPDERESFSSSRHHHPFAVKDSKPIMMNIRNAPMLPTKTNAERLADASKLREQFPVSSGSDHRTVENEWVPVEKDESKGGDSAKVFPDELTRNIDISQLVSTRLNAMRRLQDNPTDKEAMKILTSAQRDMQNWALSKQMPGQFTGSTGAKILSAEELTSGYQAWAKKGQFTNASPVTSHFGMKILQKMGWNPGEGLGKNKEGSLVPLMIDVKMDKKGLTAANEMTPRRQAIPLAKTLQGKHPVSALVELCSKRKWGPPEFEIVFDTGPDHKKNFLIQVVVNNQTFKTSCAASTKKIAKANAAAACLQALGLIPEDGAAPVKSQETLNTTSQLPTTDPNSVAPATEQPTGDSAQTTEVQPKEVSQEIPQADSDSNYTAATNSEAVSQYSTDGLHASATPYVSDGTMERYRADTSQGASQYDSSVMSQYQGQYSSDGTQNMVQYADNQTMGAYSTEAMAQYSTNGTQDMSQYQASSTDAMAQYSSTDPQAMAQYAQSAMAPYSGDGSQTSIAEYSQAYQQYSAEAIQAYQQQYSNSTSQNQPVSFSFPQPPRSLTHGITTENGGTVEGSANHGNRGDSHTPIDSRSHSGSGSGNQPDPYKNGNNSYGAGYSSSSSYNQMQYYDTSYQQGSQY